MLIAVIGTRWLTSKNEQGGRRLDDPEDFVRREIATALKRDIRVIPVLMDGASMPQSSELPDDLKLLVRRNALQVSDTGFDDDCRRLVATIEQVLEKEVPRKQIEPLTFGWQGDKLPSTGKLDPVADRLGGKSTSGTDLTPHGKGPLSREDSSNQERRKEIGFYAVIALISFLCGVILLGLMIWKADLLARLGLTGNLYYLVLLPMGLAAAGFLFGVLQSFARYRGKQLGGVLELGGPIVGFALVAIGGFVLVPSVATFPMTVYVHGAGGLQDLVLNSGDVLLDLGLDRRRQPIGSEGQAYFPSIPATFRGQEVAIGVQSDGFEVNDPNRKYRLDGGSVYLPVQRKAGHLSGRVQDGTGKPIPAASIYVAGLSTTTDSAGHFKIEIPGDRLQSELDLETIANGYSSSHLKVVPNANDVVIPLSQAP